MYVCKKHIHTIHVRKDFGKSFSQADDLKTHIHTFDEGCKDFQPKDSDPIINDIKASPRNILHEALNHL